MAYDPDWVAHGHMEAAVGLVHDWCAARPIPGLTVDVQRIPGRSPLIVCEIPATDTSLADRTVLLYGHLDKQPEFTGWRDGSRPVDTGARGRPPLRPGRCRRRVRRLRRAAPRSRRPRPRGTRMPAASSSSRPARRAAAPTCPPTSMPSAIASARPSLVVCLDSGCLDTDHLWVTTSLRGLVGGTLTVEVLTEGVHSGKASGVVPSSFRLLRQLLDRLEDSATGRSSCPSSTSTSRRIVSPPPRRTAGDLAHPIAADYPWAGAHPADERRSGRAAAQPHVAPDPRATRAPTASRPPGRPATCCGRRHRCT